MEEPDSIETSAGPLGIQPVDHASLVLTHGEAVVYIDPVGGAARYAGLAAPTAIAVTHEHGDHFDPETLAALVGERDVPLVVSRGVHAQLEGRLRALATPLGYGESGVLAGIPIRVVEAYNTSPDRLKYHPRGLGNGYVLSFGDADLYVSGDTEPNPDMLGLTGIAVAFLPMNLPYTMLAEQAAAAVKAFRPGIVYPFHYARGPEPAKFAALLAGVPGIEVRLREWYPEG